MAKRKIFADLDLNKNQLLSARYENSATFPTGPGAGQFFFNTADAKFYGWNGTAWVDLSQVVANITSVKGEIANANTTPAYPANPAVGDYYFITTTAGTVGTSEVEIGDQLVYSASGWFVVQRNLTAATTAVAGFVRLATQAEANAGALNTVALTPLALATFLANFLYARKFSVTLTTLAANTPTTITHGLSVVGVSEVVVATYQGGAEVLLDVKPTTPNALTVEANQTLGNVTIVVFG